MSRGTAKAAAGPLARLTYMGELDIRLLPVLLEQRLEAIEWPQGGPLEKKRPLWTVF